MVLLVLKTESHIDPSMMQITSRGPLHVCLEKTPADVLKCDDLGIVDKNVLMKITIWAFSTII